MADENEVKALAARMRDLYWDTPAVNVWEIIAREALRWSDETRPQQPAAAVPEGYALVPVEPTDDMLAAWLTQGERAGGRTGGDAAPWMRALRRYRAMLAAANKENNNG